MSSVAFYNHPDYLKHPTAAGHPERPERLEGLVSAVKAAPGIQSLHFRTPQPASAETLALAHHPDYVAYVQSFCEAGGGLIDGTETIAGVDTYAVAVLAAGAATDAVHAVLTSDVDRAFCTVRPPGHHCLTDRAMGFCIFNNVAVAARYAQKEIGIERVAILDWDYHHGNGTQFIFWNDPSVWFGSVHAHPAYPNSGIESETGGSDAEGTTVNCPLPLGSNHEDYMTAFDETLLPSLIRFKPDLLIISAGFDAHRDDPMSTMLIDDETFIAMSQRTVAVAEELCGGRIVSVLEGGYDPATLGRSVVCHLETMLQS